jgi:DNA uptake protein ComE-like DNA-binding protein
MNLQAIAAARKKWREQVVENPQVLFSRIGPEIACSVPGTKVRLVAFEEDAEVRFDLNTAQAGIMRLIPGIMEAEVASWLARRAEKPFAGVEDFRRRAGLRESTLAALKF